MSVVLSSITGQTRDAVAEVGDEKINFTYKPYAVTLGLSMTLSEGGTEMIEVLADVMESWDIVASEGDAIGSFPPTEENLKLIPTELASKIAEEIVSGGSNEAAESGKS